MIFLKDEISEAVELLKEYGIIKPIVDIYQRRNEI